MVLCLVIGLGRYPGIYDDAMFSDLLARYLGLQDDAMISELLDRSDCLYMIAFVIYVLIVCFQVA